MALRRCLIDRHPEPIAGRQGSVSSRRGRTDGVRTAAHRRHPPRGRVRAPETLVVPREPSWPPWRALAPGALPARNRSLPCQGPLARAIPHRWRRARPRAPERRGRVASPSARAHRCPAATGARPQARSCEADQRHAAPSPRSDKAGRRARESRARASVEARPRPRVGRRSTVPAASPHSRQSSPHAYGTLTGAWNG